MFTPDKGSAQESNVDPIRPYRKKIVHEWSLPYFRYETVFDKEMVSVFPQAPQRIKKKCFELVQIRDHIYYRNGGHLYSKCGLRFALAQKIKKMILCGNTETIPGKTLSKTFSYLKYGNIASNLTYHTPKKFYLS